MQWQAFLRKMRWKEAVDFFEVMENIKNNLEEYWNEELKDNSKY
jgi:hypothetical protein